MVGWVATVVATQPAFAAGEHRHALVIGQSTYKTGTLAAPPRDVAAVAEALAKQGFTVTKVENLAGIKDLDESVKAFAGSVPTNGTSLVYFSGHTMAVPVATGTNPPRSDTALLAVDGGKHPLTAVLRQLVVAPYGPRVGGVKSFPCGSRINVVILDATPPPPPAAAGKPGAAPAPQPAPETLPPLDVTPDTLVVFRPADLAVTAVGVAGPSPLAERLVAGLAAGKPLDAVLPALPGRTMSSVTPADLSRLKGPASRSVSPPDTLATGPEPGVEWVDRHGMVFCWCPRGEFTIGSPVTEPERQPDELRAVVTFAEGFWMAKHELCYRESLPLGGQDNNSTGEHKLLPLNATSPAHVAKILAGANANAPAGWEYGLPTEAEWEYAARAGTKTAYSFGDAPSDLMRHGNFADKTLRESQSFGEVTKWSKPRSETALFFGDRQTGLYSYAHPFWNDASVGPARVATYLPNAWGLHDMHGNVAEMTSTIYAASRTGPVLPPEQHKEWVARPENETDAARGYVCKGGSWASTPAYCRSAFRGWASVKDSILGLRLVLRRKGAAVMPPATRWTALLPAAVTTASGAMATVAADGTVTVSGTLVAGDTYTATCPVPSGIDPRELRLEVLADAALPKLGPGRGPTGVVQVSDLSIMGSRGGGPAVAIDLLDVRSDDPKDSWSRNPNAPSAAVVDGRPATFWSAAGDGKNRELIVTIGLPSRTGSDAARWRYPVESVTQGPLTSITVTIAHRQELPPASLGKFRISVLHEETLP